jgi:hypothetical protein
MKMMMMFNIETAANPQMQLIKTITTCKVNQRMQHQQQQPQQRKEKRNRQIFRESLNMARAA